MKAVITGPPVTPGTPGHWDILRFRGSGHISAWMGNHRVWRRARWGQAGRILGSVGEQGPSRTVYLRAPHPQEEVAIIPFPRDWQSETKPYGFCSGIYWFPPKSSYVMYGFEPNSY